MSGREYEYYVREYLNTRNDKVTISQNSVEDVTRIPASREMCRQDSFRMSMSVVDGEIPEQ